MRLFPTLCLFWIFCSPCATAAQSRPMELLGIDAVDYYCLRASYPEISGHVEDAEGREWLVLADGRRVLYSAAPKSAAGGNSMAGPERIRKSVRQCCVFRRKSGR